MDENDRLNPQKNEAYFQTLSRSQQISFTRRIRFEYEVNFISFIHLHIGYIVVLLISVSSTTYG